MSERIPDPLEGPRQAQGSTPKRRGRPPGSPSLTEEKQSTIIGLLRKGVLPSVAARVAGVSPRVLEEWIARGQARHPTRPPTTKLRRFAKEVTMARGLARLEAETSVFRKKPKVWLRYAARSTAEDEGWTAPPQKGHSGAAQQHVSEMILALDGADRSGRKEPKRRGRPTGSVSLTDEIHRTIVMCLRAGAFLGTAASVAGISGRTLSDWLARGEDRHSSRPGTPPLRRFAREVRSAQAEARASAEARVFEEDPLHWLRHAARTEGELEGWSEPRPRTEQEADERVAEFIESLERDRGDGPAAGPEEPSRST